MTRFKISLCILTALVITSVLPNIWLNQECGELISIAEETITFCSENNNEAAKKTALELEHEIHKFRRTANIFVKSDRLADISRISARIAPLIENGSDETSAELNELSELLKGLRDSEKPFWNNIF